MTGAFRSAKSGTLATRDSSYITGQIIYPDGGRMGLNYVVPVPDEALR